MRFALDTNILVYAENFQADKKYEQTMRLLDAIDPVEVCVPVQVLSELHRVLTWKARLGAQASAQRIQAYADSFSLAPTTWSALASSMELCSAHGLETFDALILAVAAERGCRVLLSEDMQEGFTWSGLTVANPYAVKHSPHVQSLLPYGY
jgi:predicted nucleic acid-binding protein